MACPWFGVLLAVATKQGSEIANKLRRGGLAAVEALESLRPRVYCTRWSNIPYVCLDSQALTTCEYIEYVPAPQEIR